MNQEIGARAFKPKRVNQPYMLSKSRPANNETFLSYISPQDGFEAFIDVNLLNQISEESDKVAPFETIGLLAGRVWRDEKGSYTLVLAASSAAREQIEATTSHVRISGSEMSKLREKLEVTNPALEIIGWYHSHPRFTPYYSSEDKTEQSTWSDPNHIGIVVSGLAGEETYGVYRGPNAIRLELRTEATLPEQTGDSVFQPIRSKPSPSVPKVIHKPAPVLQENKQQQSLMKMASKPPESGSAAQVLPAKETVFSSKMKLVILAVIFAFIAAIVGLCWMSYRFGIVEKELKRLSQVQPLEAEKKNSTVNPAPVNPPPVQGLVQNDSTKAPPKPVSNQMKTAVDKAHPKKKQTKATGNEGKTNNQPKDETANKATKPKDEVKPKGEVKPKSEAKP